MKRGNITRFKLNPKKPPKSDWRAFDAMSEAERHRAALSDADAAPATEAQLARARRVPTVRALRKKLNLTQEEFASRFHLPLGTVRDWEQGAHRPDKAAQVLLTVIARDPDAVMRALKGECSFELRAGGDGLVPLRQLLAHTPISRPISARIRPVAAATTRPSAMRSQSGTRPLSRRSVNIAGTAMTAAPNTT
jgi:putative transcriptional regulator